MAQTYNERPHEEPASLRPVGRIDFDWLRRLDPDAIVIADPCESMDLLSERGEIVLDRDRDRFLLVLNYPLKHTFEFEISAGSSKGFTIAALVRAVCDAYAYVYEQEERTAVTRSFVQKEHPNLFESHRTYGQFGIWGHVIGELTLVHLDIFADAAGAIYVYPGVDS